MSTVFMTFNSLVNQIQSYADRNSTTFIVQIPYFIYQAQLRIFREARDLLFVRFVKDTFQSGLSTYVKPTDWKNFVSLAYFDGTQNNFLLLKSYEFCRLYSPDATVNPPIYYADYDLQHFLISPTPNQDYPFELSYLGLPVMISINNQTNFLTNYAPDVLLYGTLLEAMPYLKVDERVDLWKSKYQEGIQSLSTKDLQRSTDRTETRSMA
jgi:hypothetical protein